ncbi:hypothetical protein B0J11DRAFT_520108 [Dendryphion nanum]|uniref:F-box domain-containing protein n=1 Tax=Dendryphion nanum TaxID=256645 RepID=A0A9P9E6X0_9PLEO|nr:hypothetical protein B0J11DRAFT_520108 [Dendryphion nanum]
MPERAYSDTFKTDPFPPPFFALLTFTIKMDSLPLPPELTLTIAELLDPYSCFYFAFTCRTHWQVCLSVVNSHKDRFDAEEGMVLDMPDYWAPIRKLLLDPSQGWYTHNLILPDRQQSLEEHLNEEDVQLGIESAKELFNNIYVDETDPDMGLEYGENHVIIPILFRLLPHLHSIHVTHCDFNDWLDYQYLPLLANAYNHPDKSLTLPFHNLRVAVLNYTRFEGCSNPLWARYFMAIPSLRRFAAHTMGGGFPSDVTEVRQSDVKELLFTHSRFDILAIDKILCQARALEQFSYDLGDASIADTDVDMKAVIGALIEYAGHSLEHLIMEAEFYEDEPDREHLSGISLLGFQKLKSLKCEFKILSPKDESEDFDIEAILPASLEVLHLEGSWLGQAWKDLIAVLDSLFGHRNTLNSIYVTNSFGGKEYRRGDVGSDEIIPNISISSNPLNQYLRAHGPSRDASPEW